MMRETTKRRLAALEERLAATQPMGPVKFFYATAGRCGPVTCDGQVFATEEEAKAAFPDVGTYIIFEVVDGRRKNEEVENAE